jgi:2-hydroxy-6-oxonona-2,4-dienedioate hydrolase
MMLSQTLPGRGQRAQTATRALVLFHGFFGDVSNWAATIARFRPRYRVLPIRFELYQRNSPYHTVASLTRAACEEMDRLGLDEAVLFGNSMGGQVALNVALEQPHRVAGLVLTGSAGLMERHLADHAPLAPSREYIRDKVEQVFFDPRHATDEIVDEVLSVLRDNRNKLRVVKLARSLRAFNMHDHLPAITAPTLLVWGKQDSITPVEVGEIFAQRLPRAQLFVLDRCGHAPNIEQPEELNRLAEEFLVEIGYV